MGRKPLAGERKSERPLRIRLTDLERALLDRSADQNGQTTSAWARRLLLQKAKALLRDG